MSIIYKVVKAKAPFRKGIFQTGKAATVKQEQVKPVEEKVEEKVVEPVVEEPVVEEKVEEPVVEEPVVKEIKLADCEEFSEKSVEFLGVNNITTVLELKDYLANNNGDLTLLAKIGKKYAAVILEELTKWESNQQ